MQPTVYKMTCQKKNVSALASRVYRVLM